MTTPDIERQPSPTGSGIDVTADVCGLPEVSLELAEALRRRSVEGAKKYGTPLRTNNGRNAAVDCYQELLDAIVYAHQAHLEYLETNSRPSLGWSPFGDLRYELICQADRLRRRL